MSAETAKKSLGRLSSAKPNTNARSSIAALDSQVRESKKAFEGGLSSGQEDIQLLASSEAQNLSLTKERISSPTNPEDLTHASSHAIPSRI